MPVTETSKQSYKKITDLGPRQLQVYYALQALEPASNRQVSAYLEKPINEITPRVKELRDLGWIVEHGKALDEQTNRRVTFWVTRNPIVERKIEHSNTYAAVSWLNEDD